MHALTAHPDVSPDDRLGATALFAVLAHLIVILGVTFVPEDRPERRPTTLDVVLVPPSSVAAPDEPDALAPANQDGGGDSVAKMRPQISAPPPAPERPAMAAGTVVPGTGTPSVEPARQPAPEVRNSLELRAEVEPARLQPTRRAATADAFESAPVSTLAAAPRASRSAALAALSAEIERELRAYPQRPRRKWISARTREHEFAAYMDAWRRKVERVGNLNYPDDAARRGLSGSLLLDVALNPDGTVEDIALRRSSGQRVLDDAAVRIVTLAAPFARFPEAIAREVDVLHIQRTWIFHSRVRFPSPQPGDVARDSTGAPSRHSPGRLSRPRTLR